MRSSARWAGYVAGAAVVVVALAVISTNWWLARTDLRPDPDSPTTTIGPLPPPEQIPLGVELTADGRLQLHVPRCPASRVDSVGWAYFPTLNTMWAIDLEDASIAQVEFVVGVAPPGYSTRIALGQPVTEIVPNDVPTSLIAVRSTDSGEGLSPATATVTLDELTPGSIRYWGPGDINEVASSLEEFQAAVGCPHPTN
jgi:hypothetical protein